MQSTSNFCSSTACCGVPAHYEGNSKLPTFHAGNPNRSTTPTYSSCDSPDGNQINIDIPSTNIRNKDFHAIPYLRPKYSPVTSKEKLKNVEIKHLLGSSALSESLNSDILTEMSVILKQRYSFKQPRYFGTSVVYTNVNSGTVETPYGQSSAKSYIHGSSLLFTHLSFQTGKRRFIAKTIYFNWTSLVHSL